MCENPSATPTVSSSTGTVPPATVIENKMNPSAAFIAFSSPVRWEALKLMATGKTITAADVVPFASTVGMARKHLRLLHEAGVVAAGRAADGRVPCYYISPEYLPEPGVVDYGFCALRFGDKAQITVSPLAKD